MPMDSNPSGVMSVHVRPSADVHTRLPKPPSNETAISPSPPLTTAAMPLAFALSGTDAASQPTTTGSLGAGDGDSPADGDGLADGLAGDDGVGDDGEGATCALHAARTTDTTANKAKKIRLMRAGCRLSRGGRIGWHAGAGCGIRRIEVLFDRSRGAGTTADQWLNSRRARELTGQRALLPGSACRGMRNRPASVRHSRGARIDGRAFDTEWRSFPPGGKPSVR
jgi:hypothetical protein